MESVRRADSVTSDSSSSEQYSSCVRSAGSDTSSTWMDNTRKRAPGSQSHDGNAGGAIGALGVKSLVFTRVMNTMQIIFAFVHLTGSPRCAVTLSVSAGVGEAPRLALGVAGAWPWLTSGRQPLPKRPSVCVKKLSSSAIEPTFTLTLARQKDQSARALKSSGFSLPDCRYMALAPWTWFRIHVPLVG
jgi:hypothetical protein